MSLHITDFSNQGLNLLQNMTLSDTTRKHEIMFEKLKFLYFILKHKQNHEYNFAFFLYLFKKLV